MAVEEIYLHPEDYELEVAAQSQRDLPFWLNLVAHEQPRSILEIGCGTGRLTIPLARTGDDEEFCVTGIDAEPRMLQRAEQRAHCEPQSVRQHLRFLNADMRTLDLSEQFDMILLPYGVAHHLLDLDEQLHVWCTLKQHLMPQGLLAIEVSAPDLHMLAQALHGMPRTADLALQQANGKRLKRSVASTYAPASQCATHSFIYEIGEASGQRRDYPSDFAMHVYFPREFLLLFAATGFVVERLIGSYDGAPFDATSEIMIALARNPL